MSKLLNKAQNSFHVREAGRYGSLLPCGKRMCIYEHLEANTGLCGDGLYAAGVCLYRGRLLQTAHTRLSPSDVTARPPRR